MSRRRSCSVRKTIENNGSLRRRLVGRFRSIMVVPLTFDEARGSLKP